MGFGKRGLEGEKRGRKRIELVSLYIIVFFYLFGSYFFRNFFRFNGFCIVVVRFLIGFCFNFVYSVRINCLYC